jgi:hypothetical protein
MGRNGSERRVAELGARGRKWTEREAGEALAAWEASGESHNCRRFCRERSAWLRGIAAKRRYVKALHPPGRLLHLRPTTDVAR